MRLKTLKNIFTPKKVRLTPKHEKIHFAKHEESRASKHPQGDRFGLRYFPYSKKK